MWEFITYGVVLGVSAGISPGPLLAVVIAQTLRHHYGEGMRVAAAPLLTDLPIIAVALLIFVMLPNPEFVLGIVSLLGAGFLLYVGVTSLRQISLSDEPIRELPRSYLKGVLVNALSPHPYLFWFGVGVPTVITAAQHSYFAASLFVVAFFVAIVGSKMAVALAVDRSRQFLSSALYLWIQRILGICLIGFAAKLASDGLAYLAVK